MKSLRQFCYYAGWAMLSKIQGLGESIGFAVGTMAGVLIVGAAMPLFILAYAIASLLERDKDVEN
jgi:hypothetical protein